MDGNHFPQRTLQEIFIFPEHPNIPLKNKANHVGGGQSEPTTPLTKVLIILC